MSNKNIAWLWNYPHTKLVKSYGVLVTYPNYYDGRTYIDLERKDRAGNLTEQEKIERSEILKQAVGSLDKLDAGELLEVSQLPKKAYLRPDSQAPEPDTLAFRFPNGKRMFSKKLYDVFTKHDLGKTHFSEVYIYDFQSDKQIIEEPYYFLNLAEKREFLDTKKSKGIRASAYEPESPERYLNFPQDDDIILDSLIAKGGVAMWQDSKLDSSIFLSDALVQDLFTTGIKQESIGLIRCTTNQ